MEEIKYQIFISSTYKDLIEAREQIMKTILSLYHFPVGMEMFSADDDEQWKIIKETIDISDYYILIIGHRYGSETSDGISFTEKEYDYAISNNVPVMVFVRDRDISTKPFERDDDPRKVKKLNSFIKKATNNRMCEFWSTTDDLSKKVSIALTKQFKRHPRPGWIKANTLDKSKENEIENLLKQAFSNPYSITPLEEATKSLIDKAKIELHRGDVKQAFCDFDTALRVVLEEYLNLAGYENSCYESVETLVYEVGNRIYPFDYHDRYQIYLTKDIILAEKDLGKAVIQAEAVFDYFQKFLKLVHLAIKMGIGVNCPKCGYKWTLKDYNKKT